MVGDEGWTFGGTLKINGKESAVGGGTIWVWGHPVVMSRRHADEALRSKMVGSGSEVLA